MKNPLTKRIATNGLLTILSLVVVFHILVMIGIIPYNIVWGGRLKDSSQMFLFELISIIINLIMVCIVGINAGLLKLKVNGTLLKIALWIMFVLFAANTIGNFFSNNENEKMVFTPMTFILSVLCFRLAIEKEKATRTNPSDM